MSIYYRPAWTCGRYNSKHKAAIFYNLIEGMSYFFEDHSADIIRLILSTPKNHKFSAEEFVIQTGIDIECINDFLHELHKLMLITPFQPDKEFTLQYRTHIKNNKTLNDIKKQNAYESLPVTTSNAERDYMNKVGGIVSVMFELTYNCSEQCIHCYNIGATRNDAEISYRNNTNELHINDYYKIIDDLYNHGLSKVTLSGGDPFSKPFIWEIIDYLYKKEIAIDIFTNGQMLTNETNRLADYFPRVVGISIYSGDATIHDKITRVKGSWEKSMKVIEQLNDLAVPITIKCCVMKPNFKSYRQVAALAEKLKVVVQYEINVTDSIEGDKCVSKYLRLDESLLEIVLRDKNVPLYIGKELPNYGSKEKIMKYNACGAGDNTFCITPDGFLIPCCAFHLILGDLKKNNISEIIGSSKEYKYWQTLTLNDYIDCGKHNYCNFCNLCAGNNYSEHHTPIKASENNCYVAKVRYNLAQKLKEGKDPLQGKSIEERIEEITINLPTNIKREL